MFVLGTGCGSWPNDTARVEKSTPRHFKRRHSGGHGGVGDPPKRSGAMQEINRYFGSTYMVYLLQTNAWQPTNAAACTTTSSPPPRQNSHSANTPLFLRQLLRYGIALAPRSPPTPYTTKRTHHGTMTRVSHTSITHTRTGGDHPWVLVTAAA